MASKLAIEIDTTSNLAGVAQTKSALDDLAVRSVPQLNASLKALQAQAAGLTDALAKPFGPAALKQFQIELDSTNADIAQTKEQIAALGAGMEAAGGQSQAALGGMMYPPGGRNHWRGGRSDCGRPDGAARRQPGHDC